MDIFTVYSIPETRCVYSVYKLCRDWDKDRDVTTLVRCVQSDPTSHDNLLSTEVRIMRQHEEGEVLLPHEELVEMFACLRQLVVPAPLLHGA